MNNIKLFPHSPLEKKMEMQSNSQDISNEGTGMYNRKYEPSIAFGVICYIPDSFHLIFMGKWSIYYTNKCYEYTIGL